MSSTLHLSRLFAGRPIRLVIAGFVLVWLSGGARLSAAADQLALLSGAAEQGGLMIFKCAPGCRARLDGQPLFVDGDGHFVIGFHRDDTASLTLEVQLPDGQPVTRQLAPARRHYDIQSITGLPGRYVSPPDALLARIRTEAGQVRQARQIISDQNDFIRDGFDWPASGPVTGIYGSQRILNGQPRQPHFGIDIAIRAGTKVQASAAGRVVLAADLYYTGWTIILDHGHGVSSTYSHLQSIDVALGQQLERGAVLGLSGSTGRSTGPHLDWRINWLDKRLDPQRLAANPASQ